MTLFVFCDGCFHTGCLYTRCFYTLLQSSYRYSRDVGIRSCFPNFLDIALNARKWLPEIHIYYRVIIVVLGSHHSRIDFGSETTETPYIVGSSLGQVPYTGFVVWLPHSMCCNRTRSCNRISNGMQQVGLLSRWTSSIMPTKTTSTTYTKLGRTT